MIPAALLRRIPRLGDWKEACPAGAPVRDSDCAGLDCDTLRLTALREGQSGMISCLAGPASTHAARLASMGVLPGTRITLVQRYPAFVFRLGYAEFAVDEDLAARIGVRLDPS